MVGEAEAAVWLLVVLMWARLEAVTTSGCLFARLQLCSVGLRWRPPPL